MAKPFRRRNKGGQFFGTWYQPLKTGEKINLELSGADQADEALRRGTLVLEAHGGGARGKKLREAWKAPAVARSVADAGDPARAEKATAAVAAAAPPPLPSPAPAPEPTKAALPPPSPPPPVDPAAAVNEAAEEIDGAEERAAADDKRSAFESEFASKFPELAGLDGGALDDVVWDKAAAMLLWLERKIPELGVSMYFRTRDKRTLETRPSDPKDLTRQATAFCLRHVVLRRWPNLFDKVTPELALFAALAAGGFVAVAEGACVWPDGRRAPALAALLPGEPEGAAAPEAVAA